MSWYAGQVHEDFARIFGQVRLLGVLGDGEGAVAGGDGNAGAPGRRACHGRSSPATVGRLTRPFER